MVVVLEFNNLIFFVVMLCVVCVMFFVCDGMWWCYDVFFFVWCELCCGCVVCVLVFGDVLCIDCCLERETESRRFARWLGGLCGWVGMCVLNGNVLNIVDWLLFCELWVLMLRRVGGIVAFVARRCTRGAFGRGREEGWEVFVGKWCWMCVE